jgi:calcium-dependent phosphoinositide phospholipase C
VLSITQKVRPVVAGAALGLALLAAARGAAAQVCDGDCDRNGTVGIAELMLGVDIALGKDAVERCAPFDVDRDEQVQVYELIAAVRRALQGCPPSAYPRDNELRLNQIQVLGTHNSYHIQADAFVFQQIANVSLAIAQTLEYSHIPLADQFDTQGIRQIELDVFADPDGGLYASPLGVRLETGDPNARIPSLEAPGFKVLHVQDIDYRTTCETFVECLQTVKAWSDAHPLHMPIMILIEAKDDALPPNLGYDFVVPLPIGAAELDGIDAEIRSVFSPERLITPDDVRGAHATLADAVRTDGWPTLAASRGKVLFCLDNASRRPLYLEGHPSLQGRVMFSNASVDVDDAAFIEFNDSVGSFDAIQAAVAAGFVVRTRSDADTNEARSGNTVPRDMALASGAQWVSTDYPVPNPAFGTGFQVAIPNGMPARCNPINAPADCTALDLEDPSHLQREE